MPASPRVLLTVVLAACPLLSAPRDPVDVRAALAAHDRAVHVLDVWMRDAYVPTGPDGAFYLTGTTANQDDPLYSSPGPEEVQKFQP